MHLPVSLLLLALPGSRFTLEFGRLPSMTPAHWERQMENVLHFVCTIGDCGQKAAVTNKKFSLYIYTHYRKFP